MQETRIRICFVSDAGDVHTHRWVKYFVDKGHEVHLISFRLPSEDLENVNFHLLKKFDVKTKIFKYVINSLYVLRQIKKLIKEIKPDIIHGHGIGGRNIPVALTGFHPFVASAWGSDVLIYPKESKIVRYTVPLILRRADIITCDGENTREAMIKMGIESEKIKTIMHGADTKKSVFLVERLSNNPKSEEKERKAGLLI